jgi:pimeloyl-ACP methyl ester carboxylesterase
MEQAFFFDCQGHRLFGIAHRPERRAGELGFVFCHPYGEEKQFSYRVLVRFAQELARAGFPVLRFDSYGYGDSDGVLEDSTIESLVQETLGVRDLAREIIEVRHVALLGLRLGATVAALAAERDTSTPALILWSPIEVGSRYVEELLRQRLFREIATWGSALTREELLEQLDKEGAVEIAGDCLTRAMAADLSKIDLATQVAHFVNPVLVTTIKNRRGRYSEVEAVVDRYRSSGSPSELRIGEEAAYWDDRSMSAWYHPQELYDQTLSWIHSRWPG